MSASPLQRAMTAFVAIVLSFFLPSTCLAAAGATDPEWSFEELPKTAESATAVGRDLGLVVMPIPQSNPTLGTGLTLAGLLLYNPAGTEGRPWVTALGAMYTDTNSRAFGIVQKAYLLDDQFRVTGGLGHASLNVNFYGIGESAAGRGISIPIRQVGDVLMLKALARVAENLYVGARYRRIELGTTVELPQSLPGAPAIPPPELQSVSAGLGLVLEYDTRDNEFNPRRGRYLKIDTNFPRAGIGSDLSYQQLHAAYNYYLPLRGTDILALRAAGCVVGGNVPYYDLCLFGVHNDLRGYEGGKYRHKALLALQGEYRTRLSQRWGAVAFAGVGSVAASLADLGTSRVLPSAGVGIRYLASKRHNVNVSVDLATGQDGTAVYFYIGESF
jgi:outer membrane protein assembly factor BamA